MFAIFCENLFFNHFNCGDVNEVLCNDVQFKKVPQSDRIIFSLSIAQLK